MYWPISFSNTSSCGTYLSHPLLSSFRHLSSLLSYSHLHFFLTDSFRPPPLWASKHPSKIPQIPQNIVQRCTAMYSDVQRGGHDGNWSSDLLWVSPAFPRPLKATIGLWGWLADLAEPKHMPGESQIVTNCFNMSQYVSSVFKCVFEKTATFLCGLEMVPFPFAHRTEVGRRKNCLVTSVLIFDYVTNPFTWFPQPWWHLSKP